MVYYHCNFPTRFSIQYKTSERNLLYFFQFKMTLLKCDIVTLALFIFHSEMRAPLVSGEKKRSFKFNSLR